MATITDPSQPAVGNGTLHIGATSAGPNLGSSRCTGLETGPFASLVQNFRDAFFPEKLPPLVLESKPIAVANPMDVKRDPKSVATAVVAHALIFLLIFWISTPCHQEGDRDAAEDQHGYVCRASTAAATQDRLRPSPWVAVVARTTSRPSRRAGCRSSRRMPIVPPSSPPKIPPTCLPVDPAINVQTNLHMTNNNMPNLGMPNAPNVGVNSLGNGSGGGLGNGRGNGWATAPEATRAAARTRWAAMFPRRS